MYYFLLLLHLSFSQPNVTESINDPKNQMEEDIQTQASGMHDIIRRITVFPISANKEFKNESEKAWWKTREILSQQQRFLISTKRFLEQKDVFQSRKELKISDAILLSKMLESDCLITTFLEDRRLRMQAYSGQDGQLLWSKHIDLISSKPLKEQIEESTQKLVYDFIASIPYHGFQIIDPLGDKAFTENNEDILVKVDLGAKSEAQIGQKAQWIEINRVTLAPLFQGGSQIKILAEGEIVKYENQIATIKVKRARDFSIFEKKAMIQIPDESSRLAKSYLIKDSIYGEISTAYLSDSLKETSKKNESRPLLTSLASIANILIILLLIF